MINKIVFPVGLFAESESTRDSKTRFSCWFIKEVEPINKLLSEGETVYLDSQFSGWHSKKGCRAEVEALLIRIPEIKPDSFEAVVRDYLEWKKFETPFYNIDLITNRMKKLLGDNK